MQKVVGSNPISRLQFFGMSKGFMRFSVRR
jgi:hypothetical protein